jgi:hypothetical protein
MGNINIINVDSKTGITHHELQQYISVREEGIQANVSETKIIPENR